MKIDLIKKDGITSFYIGQFSSRVLCTMIIYIEGVKDVASFCFRMMREILASFTINTSTVELTLLGISNFVYLFDISRFYYMIVFQMAF